MSRADVSRIAGLHALADDAPAWPRDVRGQVSAALEGEASVIQLRLKHMPDREALALARWARARCHEAGALLIVNDRFDLADLADADGVHLGQDDVAPEELPAAVRARCLVGWSTHTLEQVEAAALRPVDYIGFGPVFGTASKDSPWSARGVEGLARAVERARCPVIAIGGIDAARAGSLRAAGAAGLAVIGALAGADDPPAAARALREAFEAGS